MKTIITLATLAFMTNAFANTAVDSTNRLGMKLALEASQDVTKEKNFMISPLSLSQAVMLAGNGTDAGTRLELETLLGDRIEKFNVASQSLVKSLNFANEKEKAVKVSINNSIWNTNGATDHAHYEFSSSFKKNAVEYFNAEVFAADFRKQSAVDAINGWADKKTFGLVKKIIELDVLQDMLWVVMNATYMEASWVEPFYNMGDSSPAFQGLNNKTMKVPMISGQQGIGHAVVNGADVATLSFTKVAGAPELEMVIYLPSEGVALKESQSAFFDAKAFKKLRTALSTNRELARVTMPKFSFDTSVQMKDGDALTEAMGMNFLFSDLADFSMMQTPESLASKVGLIRQNSRIELDEKGVKAAAVTIIGGVRTTSVRPQPSMNFVVNRPFHFAIVEKKSEAVLFAGTVVEPK
ncbi:MAG: serpin family protein [Bdellovibrionota bacterium]